MLTFSEAVGQQIVHTADMLTFSEAAGQQIAHIADMLTFLRLQVTIYRIIYLQRSVSFRNISRKLSTKYKFLNYKSKTFDNIKNFDLKIYDFTIKNNMHKMIYYRA